MEKRRIYNLFRGMLLGLFVPTVVIALLFITNNTFLKQLTGVFVIPMALLQLPTVLIGRACRLPIETGNTAFIMCDFTTFGYILTVILWIFIGAFIGWKFGIEFSRSNKSDQKQTSTASYPLICPKCGKGYDSSWKVCLQCRAQLNKNQNYQPPPR